MGNIYITGKVKIQEHLKIIATINTIHPSPASGFQKYNWNIQLDKSNYISDVWKLYYTDSVDLHEHELLPVKYNNDSGFSDGTKYNYAKLDMIKQRKYFCNRFNRGISVMAHYGFITEGLINSMMMNKN